MFGDRGERSVAPMLVYSCSGSSNVVQLAS